MRLCAFTDEANPLFDEQIKAMHRNGLKLTEIRGVDKISIADIDVDKAKQIKETLDQNGFVVWSVGSPIGKTGIADDFDKHLEKFKHLTEISHILGVDHMRIFSFFTNVEMSHDNLKNEVFTRLEKLVDNADGITLCLENEKDIYGDVYQRNVEILSQFPKIKAVYDPANYIQVGCDAVEAYNAVKPYIEYIHIKDCAEDKSTIVPAGQGIGNIEYIIDDYLKSGGDVITVEPHLFEFSGLKGLENGSNQSKVGSLNFETGEEAFDAGVNAVKNILSKLEVM